jgi:hypothetical protein
MNRLSRGHQAERFLAEAPQRRDPVGRGRVGSPLAAASVLLALGGCATVVESDRQVVVIETRSSGAEVTGAQCMLANPQGESFATTPGRVWVRRSFDGLKILCEKPGYAPREALLKSDVKPTLLGNLVLGGAIGFTLDHVSGSAYEYPSAVVVDLGPLTAAVPSVIDPATRRAQALRESVQRALAGDERRSVELVRRTACDPAEPPALVRQEGGTNQFATRCVDGRVAVTLCRQAECRFKAGDD